MRFYICGFDQQTLFEKYNNLNGNDIIVLRVLVDMIPRLTRKLIVENKEFTQVTYELLLQDVPFVTQSLSTLKKIVQKLIDAGLIERHIVNKGGKFTYFRITKKLIELQEKKEIEKRTVEKTAKQENSRGSVINKRLDKHNSINQKNRFNNFQQRNYTSEQYDYMERVLLNL